MSFVECIKIITCGCFGVLEPSNNQQNVQQSVQQNVRRGITYTFAIKNNNSESESDEEQWMPPIDWCSSPTKHHHASPPVSPTNIEMTMLNSSPKTTLLQRRSPTVSPITLSPPLLPVKSELNISPSSNSSWEVLNDNDKIDVELD